MLNELKLRPGFYSNETDRGAQGRWKDGDHVRFREGLPEKIGGWIKYALSGAVAVTHFDKTFTTVEAGSAGMILGDIRSATDWVALDSTKFMAIGTHWKLYLMQNAILYDITPLRLTSVLTNPFTTTVGSPIITVTHAGHGAGKFDFVTFTGATAVGGVTISGNYQVVSVVSGNSYTIQHSSNASSAATGGGSVTAAYEIPVGLSGSETTLGYGIGGYSGGFGYGLPIPVSDDSFTSLVEVRFWSLDSYGEDLIASPRAGPIYYWDKTFGPTSRAVLVATAPSQNNRVFVDHEARIVISAGSNDGLGRDQLLVRWSDQEDYTQWTPALNNSAGDFRLQSGSRIIAYEKTRRENVLFTDEGLYSMLFQGGDLVYSFTPLGESIGISGPESSTESNGVVFFSTGQNFFYYDGVVKEIPCDVRTKVFGELNQFKLERMFTVVNRVFDEVWFLYPSGTANDNDRYAAYNYKDQNWVTGTIPRQCMHDFSGFFKKPYGFNDGKLYIHETGANDDTIQLLSRIETYDFEISAGSDVHHVSALVPDFDSLVGDATITLTAKQYPNSAPVVKGPYAVTFDTKRLNVRARGRQIAMRFEQSGLNTTWRMGTWRLDTAPDGVR